MGGGLCGGIGAIPALYTANLACWATLSHLSLDELYASPIATIAVKISNRTSGWPLKPEPVAETWAHLQHAPLGPCRSPEIFRAALARN